MTDCKISDLKKTARDILVYNRMQLLNKHPFIGNIAMNLNLIPIRDARCDTAMTDGKTIYFDIDFLSRLNNDEIQFVLGHEIWHVVMMHFLRKDERDQMTFNMACDMEVNQILSKDGFMAPSDALFPNHSYSSRCKYNFPSDLSAEEYFEYLIKYFENYHEKPNNGIDQMNDESVPEKSKKQKQKCSGQFDKHFDKNENLDQALAEAIEKGSEDKYGKKAADEEFCPRNIKTENNVKEAAEEIREMVVSSAQNYERFRGELPGHIKKYVDKLLESKLPWKEILSAFITAGFQNKTNWSVPNRRFAYKGTYLPSHDGEMMRIAVGIDTSGSCERDCEKFLTEINGIAKTFGSYELHVIQCDTNVKDYKVYDEGNPLDPNDKIEFKGFGGTHLHPIFDYIDLNNIDVDAAVIFTDGYCEPFKNDEMIDLPVMWMITGNNDCKNIQIGEKIYIK